MHLLAAVSVAAAVLVLGHSWVCGGLLGVLLEIPWGPGIVSVSFAVSEHVCFRLTLDIALGLGH